MSFMNKRAADTIGMSHDGSTVWWNCLQLYFVILGCYVTSEKSVLQPGMVLGPNMGYSMSLFLGSVNEHVHVDLDLEAMRLPE